MAGRGNSGAIRAGNAFVEFSIRDKGVAAGLDRIQKRFEAAGAAMRRAGAGMAAASGAITGAFAAAAGVFASTGAALDDMAKRTGFGITALSELKFAAEQSGAGLEDVEKSVKGMSKFLLNASRGGASMVATLADLGLSLESLAGKSPEEQFRILSEAIARVDDPTKRAALAMKIFGSAGQKLLPLFTEGPQGFAALREQAHKLGVTMSTEDATAAAKLDDAFAALKAQFTGVAVAIGAAVAGPLTDFVGKVGEAITVVINWARHNQGLVTAFAGVSAGLLAISAATIGLGTVFGGLASAVGAVNVAFTFLAAHPVVAAVGAITATIGWLVAEFYRAHDAVTAFDDALQGLNGKQTFGDPQELQSLITRFDQLAKRQHLTTAEQKEAREVLQKLREEYGLTAAGIDTTTGAITNAAKAQAQLQAARGGRSVAVQSQSIGQAEMALESRKIEGADAAEIAERTKAIAAMRAELERTKRIIGDAAPAAMPAMGGISPEAQAAATANAGMQAAMAGPATAPNMNAAMGQMKSFDDADLAKLIEIEMQELGTLREIKKALAPLKDLGIAR